MSSQQSLIQPLETKDPEIYKLIQEEYERQKYGLEMIASENFTSLAVMECLGSVLTNKYAEGLPGKRYYGGNEVVDKIESLCIQRALAAFRLSPMDWGVNVQPYSGSVANLAAYAGLLKPHDRIMGLDLPSGGHLTHGYYTKKRKVSATSIFFESMPYHIGPSGYIDYDELEKSAQTFCPKLIICGASAYPRDFDYERLRAIADSVGAYLLCDMAHISGLVAAEEAKNPFELCDIVTTTTHKTLRGPRSAMIFFRKEHERAINSSVFPGLQGGPHENQIAAVATQLLEVVGPGYKKYAQQVRKNAKALATSLMEYGYTLSTGGTDNHLILVNLRELKLTGSKVEKVLEYINISVNKNTVYGDVSAMSPGGIRIGTPALTTRGLVEKDFIVISHWIHRAIQIALSIQKVSGRKLRDFVVYMRGNEELDRMKEEVRGFSGGFKFY